MTVQERIVKEKGCHVICDNTVLSKPEWLAVRKGYINGTDAGKLAGVCHWGDQMSVYLDKTLAPAGQEQEPDNWFKLECGLALEELIAKWYGKATGYQVEPVTWMLQHPTLDMIAGDLDYIAQAPDGELIGVEIKTTDEINVTYHEQFKAGLLGQDGVLPAQYEYQVRHYMAVTGLPRFVVLVCYGFDKSKVLPVMVYRDLDKEAAILRMEQDFWNNHIIPRIPPEQEGLRKEDLKTIQKAEFQPEEEPGELPEEARSLLESYQNLSSFKKSAEEKVKEYDGQINAVLAEICRVSKGLPVATLPIDETQYFEVVNKIGGRTTVDSTKLKTIHPDIYEEVKKCSEFEQTTVKVKKLKAAKGGAK